VSAADAPNVSNSGRKASIARIVDQAPPLPADAIALLRAAGIPTVRTEDGEKAA
jgi:hypothetical protein